MLEMVFDMEIQQNHIKMDPIKGIVTIQEAIALGFVFGVNTDVFPSSNDDCCNCVYLWM